MVRCKNVRSEKVAKTLDRVTNNFNIWLHDDTLYAYFRTKSLEQLMKVKEKLSGIKGVEFRFMKIQKVKRLWIG